MADKLKRSMPKAMEIFKQSLQASEESPSYHVPQNSLVENKSENKSKIVSPISPKTINYYRKMFEDPDKIIEKYSSSNLTSEDMNYINDRLAPYGETINSSGYINFIETEIKCLRQLELKRKNDPIEALWKNSRNPRTKRPKPYKVAENKSSKIAEKKGSHPLYQDYQNFRYRLILEHLDPDRIIEKYSRDALTSEDMKCINKVLAKHGETTSSREYIKFLQSESYAEPTPH